VTAPIRLASRIATDLSTSLPLVRSKAQARILQALTFTRQYDEGRPIAKGPTFPNGSRSCATRY